VQSALLEAMQERSVTIGHDTHVLDEPFLVLATQNPIEQEGTYALPEAQLDRFMYQIKIGYPTEDEELEIVRRSSRKSEVVIERVLGGEEIQKMQVLVRHAPVADHVIRYALRLARSTRVPGPGEADTRPKVIRDYVGWGAGPRASEYLILAAKAKAILAGRTHAEIEDVKAAALPVLRHRVLTNFNAEADQVSSDEVVRRLLDEVEVASDSPSNLKAVDRLMG